MLFGLFLLFSNSSLHSLQIHSLSFMNDFTKHSVSLTEIYAVCEAVMSKVSSFPGGENAHLLLT